MAEKRTLARPYANALFDVANAEGRLAEWSQALHAAAAVVADEGAAALLGRPGMPDETLVAFVTETATAVDASAGETLSGERGRNLMRLLAENGRLRILPEIAGLFDELKDEAERSVDVDIVSAEELTPEARERFAGVLQKRLGRSVRLHCTTDPNLIGGAVIRADDLVIDGSLKSRLGKLANALIR